MRIICAYNDEHAYPVEYQREWPRHGGDGYGPVPICTALVTDPRTGAGQVCGGPLLIQGDLRDIVEEVEADEEPEDGGEE